MANPGLRAHGWRLVASDGPSAATALLAAVLWLAGAKDVLLDHGEPAWLWAALAIPATVVAAFVHRRRARRLKTSFGAVVRTLARVRENVQSPNKKMSPSVLTYDYTFSGRAYSRQLPYTPGSHAARKLAEPLARRVGITLPRDVNGWMVRLRPGDSIEILVDPRKPERSFVAALDV